MPNIFQKVYQKPYQTDGVYKPNLAETLAQKSFVKPYTVPNTIVQSNPIVQTNPIIEPTGGKMVVADVPTTLSNQTVNDQVNKNITTLDEMTANRGMYVDENGLAHYQDGSIGKTPEGFNTPATTTIAKEGETPLVVSDTAPEDQATQDLLEQMKSSSDASTKGMIDSIQQMFSQRKIEQQDIGRRQLAGVQNALLMGGATGGFGSAAFAPISSTGIVTAQESFNLKQLAQLDAEENSLIAAAKAAQASNDWKIMDKKMSLLEEKRKEKMALAEKVNNQILEQNKKIQEQNQKLADQQQQFDKENNIVEIYTAGTTDLAGIMAEMKNRGVSATSKDISDIIKNIKPDASQIQLLAKTLSEKGVDQKTIQAVLSSPDYESALLASGDGLSQMNPAEKLDYELKQAQIANQWANLAKTKAESAKLSAETPATSATTQKNTSDQLDFLIKTANEASDLSGASGKGVWDRVSGWFVGSNKYNQLEAKTNTLRTNVLSLMTDPNVKKFFGPQMSDADVRLMTAAGTTLNPEQNTPTQLKDELTRLNELFTRMKNAVAEGGELNNYLDTVDEAIAGGNDIFSLAGY